MKVVAPGKLVLVGEYAVLDGAPAIVAAVDRGVSCTVTAATDGAITIDVPDDDRFVRPALNAVGAPPGRYTFAAHRPVLQTPHKVGLGSSAAAVVAAVLAGQAALGRIESAESRFTTAHRVHRAVQGSGSGIDVAASSFGGVLRFEDGKTTQVPPVSPIVVFSGTPAATGPRVARYRQWAGKARNDFVAESRAIVQGFAADPVDALDRAGQLLKAMGDAARISVFTRELLTISDLARTHGGAAKPSGAGGGDVAVALFYDPKSAAAFRQACDTAGFIVVDVGIAGPAFVLP